MEGIASSNKSVEPTGGSRYGWSVFLSLRRLPPVAHAWRSPDAYAA